MPDETPESATSDWTRTVDIARLAAGPQTAKIGGRQIAIFLHEGVPRACNNRCPHEGYPLVEGMLDAGCVLTCNWHNWKFDLTTGDNLYGGDNLRVYPAKVAHGAVWVDIRDPPAGERIAHLLKCLDEAMADYDTPRIARELARLAKAGATPDVALTRAILGGYERLRYGMTHAFAAAEVWLRLRDRLEDEVQRLVCASETLAHIAFDTLREEPYPFALQRQPWNGARFNAAMQAQDEVAATALVEGALESGLGFADIESTLTSVALAHYQDFGHSLIYLVHVRRLVDRLGPETTRPLLLNWLRSVIHATREDLLPDFRAYAGTLANWPSTTHAAVDPPPADAFEGRSIKEVLAATLDFAASHSPLAVYHALMEAAARHLLRFDERFATATENPVSDNVGWLDFSHALTFGHALREQCTRMPEFWPQGLLQLALFVGRNSHYLDPRRAAGESLRQWRVEDESAFDAGVVDTLVDHGIGLPIFPAHWLKTWTAVRDELALGVPPDVRQALLAAANRLLSVRFKERHALRTSRQALAFVGREE
ncbi:MAG: Rieske (2Fe-2S) protein [Betaproteobacteria bacterium]